ncbi:MAG: glycosyltransferase family 4 protein [Bryobacteraceae bacterium]|jgi:glycosyltransferase involved in cell wall biosynthesis
MLSLSRLRVLYIQASWVPPPEDPQADRFLLLSETLEGDVLHPLWFWRPEQVEAELGGGARSGFTRGRFRFHWFCCFRPDGRRRRLGLLWFYLRKGLELHRKKPYDCIVVYSHMTPALVAGVLKLLTGARLIVEIMTAPELSYLYEHPRRTLVDRLMRVFSDLSLHLSVWFSDRVHLLYRTQLAHYPMLRRAPSSVFHDFVPVSLIRAAEGERERVALFVGAPWYLKGVDLLIEAFRRIAGDFPDITLRIQGHFPDRAALDALAAGVPRVEIVKAVPNPETIGRISRALVLVHPSRCEGLSRVLIEAMSAGVPVIASDAGGNPYCIRDGQTGVLFPAGNAGQLSERLRELLGDEELRRRLGSRGYELAHTQLTEQVYADQFTRMVQAAVHGGRQARG